MSKNITAQQLAGNQKTYGIDEFRNMVNYTNTTNKGYVRFRLTSEGLKLEKINNKIDFPLSWRSNVSAAHNMAIRTKFLQAMENDLKYMGDAGTTIRNLIITPKKTDGTQGPQPPRHQGGVREVRRAVQQWRRAPGHPQ